MFNIYQINNYFSLLQMFNVILGQDQALEKAWLRLTCFSFRQEIVLQAVLSMICGQKILINRRQINRMIILVRANFKFQMLTTLLLLLIVFSILVTSRMLSLLVDKAIPLVGLLILKQVTLQSNINMITNGLCNCFQTALLWLHKRNILMHSTQLQLQ